MMIYIVVQNPLDETHEGTALFLGDTPEGVASAIRRALALRAVRTKGPAPNHYVSKVEVKGGDIYILLQGE